MTTKDKLIRLGTFDRKRVIFSKPKANKNKQLHCQVQYRNDDGSVGRLLLETPELFSFGVQAEWPYGTSKEQQTESNSDKIVGYKMSLSLTNNDNIDTPTKEQKQYMDALTQLWEDTYTFLKKPEILKELGRTDQMVIKADGQAAIKKPFTSSVTKKDTKGEMRTYPPMKYTKLIWWKDDQKFQTTFRDASTGEITSPLEFEGKMGNARCVDWIKSVFVGQHGTADYKASLQSRIFECRFSTSSQSSGPTDLLGGSNTSYDEHELPSDDESEDEGLLPPKNYDPEEESGSESESDEEEEVVATAPPVVKAAPVKKAPVRRRAVARKK